MLTQSGSAYWRLMRFDKPIGIALLWYPVAWSLWLSAVGLPSVRYLFLFLMGTIIMRAAGCVINDISDRHLDGHVERTEHRPLVSGDLSLSQALVCFAILIGLAVGILLQLPEKCFVVALIAVVLTGLYPLTKRWFDVPQLILGLAFTSSIPMVYVATVGHTTQVMWLLMLLNICWVIAYDTAYAMVDRDDDRLMGMHSSAIYFGKSDSFAIFILQAVTHLLWLPIAVMSNLSEIFYVFWLFGLIIFAYQQHLIQTRKRSLCFKAFLNNHWYGVVMWAGLVISIAWH